MDWSDAVFGNDCAIFIQRVFSPSFRTASVESVPWKCDSSNSSSGFKIDPAPEPQTQTIPKQETQQWTPTAKAREWKYIVLHHTASDRGSVESIDEAHRGRGWKGVGYHFVIGNGKGTQSGVTSSEFRTCPTRPMPLAGSGRLRSETRPSKLFYWQQVERWQRPACGDALEQRIDKRFVRLFRRNFLHQ